MRALILAASLLLAGCAVQWKSAPEGANFKRDNFECARDAQAFRNPTARGFNALADDVSSRRMYIECMEGRGYAR